MLEKCQILAPWHSFPYMSCRILESLFSSIKIYYRRELTPRSKSIVLKSLIYCQCLPKSRCPKSLMALVKPIKLFSIIWYYSLEKNGLTLPPKCH